MTEPYEFLPFAYSMWMNKGLFRSYLEVWFVLLWWLASTASAFIFDISTRETLKILFGRTKFLIMLYF